MAEEPRMLAVVARSAVAALAGQAAVVAQAYSLKVGEHSSQ